MNVAWAGCARDAQAIQQRQAGSLPTCISVWWSRSTVDEPNLRSVTALVQMPDASVAIVGKLRCHAATEAPARRATVVILPITIAALPLKPRIDCIDLANYPPADRE